MLRHSGWVWMCIDWSNAGRSRRLCDNRVSNEEGGEKRSDWEVHEVG